jgi:Carboxypeptidase regulatory-like domain
VRYCSDRNDVPSPLTCDTRRDDRSTHATVCCQCDRAPAALVRHREAMQRILAALAVVAAFLAGRETKTEVHARPATQREVVTVQAPAQVARCPSVPVAEPDTAPVDDVESEDDPDAIDIADTAAVRQLELEAKRRVALETNLGARGAIFGTARDAKSGEVLIGVTVIASARGTELAAISDELGYYQITDLEPDTYTVTFYYDNITMQHGDVAVAARKSTPVYTKLDTSHGDHGRAITIETSYVRSIPVPARTFDGVLGADGEGVSFTGTTSLENEYIVVE